ncbi:MAG: Bug family tripartite tricarboxylate transporter substrate binding protein [Xanthobacteraceae bacterium]
MIAPTRCIHAALVVALLLAANRAGQAQNYPTQNIKLVVPFAAGGGVDVVARIIGPPLSALVGQPIVIENRAGAGGATGATAVAQAAPDGYTLLLGTGSTHGTNPNVYTRLSYDAVRDFEPIALVSASPLVLVANSDVPAKSTQELIALAKSKSGELAFGSYGTGSINHLAGELFNSMAGIQANHIPYRGSAPMMTDLIGGRLQYAFDGASTTLGYIQNKTVRMLGLSGTRRSPVYPDEPTISESALPGFDATVWFALFAPAKTPRTVINLLNSKINTTLADPEVKAGFARLGMEPIGGGPDVLAEKTRSELEKWAKLVREKNIRIEQ